MKKISFFLAGALLLSCLLVVLMGCDLFGSGYEKYENAELYTVGDLVYNAKDVQGVKIYWFAGSITVSHGEHAELRVTEDRGVLTEEQRMRCLVQDGILYVRFCQSGYQGSFAEQEKSLTVQIPQDVDLTVESVSADLELGQLKGKSVSLNTVSGNINAAEIAGTDVTVNTVSGELRTSALACGAMKVTTVSGDISLPHADADTVTLDTVSGAMVLGLSEGMTVSAKSTSGDLRLYRGSVGLTLTLDTVSGELNTKHTYERVTDGQYRFGNGAVGVSLETTSGNVTVEW